MSRERRTAVRARDDAEESDADALARVAKGEIDALGKIYDRHHVAVLRFVARASGNANDAEDIVHAAFLTVAKIAGSYDGRVSCRPWLLGVAARVLQQRRRGAARFARMLSGFAWWSKGASHDPQNAIAARGELSVLERAIAQMSEPKRIVLLMAEVEGVPCEQIAHALEIPVGTVWTRLHAARRELRAALGEGGAR